MGSCLEAVETGDEGDKERMSEVEGSSRLSDGEAAEGGSKGVQNVS